MKLVLPVLCLAPVAMRLWHKKKQLQRQDHKIKLSAIGLLAGGALAAGLANLLETLLFGVTAVAPGIYVGTAGTLLLVALMACVIPAQRASRVDPAVALRND